MAVNPLKQKMQDAGQVDIARGMTPREAQAQIASLLDGDGRAPGHQEIAEEGDRVRGQQEFEDSAEHEHAQDEQNLETEDEAPAQEHEADTGDTEGNELDVGGEGEETEGSGSEEQAASDEEDGETITTVEELATALEMPVDQILALTLTAKAAGEEHSATLSDLLAGYRLQADYDRDKGALAEERRALQVENQKRVEDYNRNANVLAQQLNLVEQHLTASLNDPRVARLREDDPAEWNARVTEVNNQLTQLRGYRAQAATQYDQFMQQQRLEFAHAEREKLIADVDGWGEEKLGIANAAIKSLGYSDQELEGMADSRLIKGALELSQLRAENAALKQQIAQGESAVKQVKKTLPKGLKPGKGTSKRRSGPDTTAIARASKRLKNSGKTEDAAQLLLARGIV